MLKIPPPADLEILYLEAVSDEELLRGWRYVPVTLPDGRSALRQVLLTSDDYLNPQEGDFVPEDTFHQTVTETLHDILKRHLAPHATLTAFNDLLIQWPSRGLPNASPDIAVIPNVKDPERRRGSFDTDEEGTQPVLAIEVVSPTYRKEDREDKVQLYERAGIPEYFIFDQRTQRGQTVDEVLGYRLRGGRYSALTPNEDGLLYSESLGLWFGLEGGRPVVVDAQTGERLLNSSELESRAAEEAEARRIAEIRAEEAEAHATAEAEARRAAETELERLRAELRRLQGKAD